jgi:cyclophilin family peptidyl-prolyl cis-trans isomerase
MTRNLLPVFAAAMIFVGGLALGQTPSANPKVLLKTSKGDITLELYPAQAPITVKNFLDYVNTKFYDGTIFHRVIPGFMVQGGGMTADMSEKASRPTIKNEAANGLKNDRGSIAMARLPGPDTAGSQFFINLVNNDGLNHRDNSVEGFGYCVFGKVVSGMDVVDAIAKVQTGNKRGHQNVPIEPVTLLSAAVVK